MLTIDFNAQHIREAPLCLWQTFFIAPLICSKSIFTGNIIALELAVHRIVVRVGGSWLGAHTKSDFSSRGGQLPFIVNVRWRRWATGGVSDASDATKLREAQLYANEQRRQPIVGQSGKEREKAEREENNGEEINYCSFRFPRASQDVMDPDGPTATGPAFPSQICRCNTKKAAQSAIHGERGNRFSRWQAMNAMWAITGNFFAFGVSAQ